MKKLYLKRNIVLLLVAGFAGMSIYSATGPGNTFGVNVTGAPFDGGTCNNCHSGGSYSASVTIQLLSGSTPVTSYTPGNNYTLRITRAAPGLAAIPTGGFGFQMTCARSANAANINNWGTLPANVATANLNGRDYVEHSAKFPHSTTQVNIPWTAPSLGTGSVVFYIALNTVNGNGNTTGDQVLSTSLTISESNLPLTWLSFSAKESGKNQVLLEWSVANMTGNDFFTIEKSNDGKAYSLLANVDAVDDKNAYSHIDKSPSMTTFYRLKQTDINGECQYYKTIQATLSNGYTKAYHYYQGSTITIQYLSNKARTATVSIYNISGGLVASEPVVLQEGRSDINVSKPSVNGMYLLQLTSGSEVLYSDKVFIQ